MSNDNETSEAVRVRSGYANGFAVGVSLSDVSIVLMVDGQPLQKVHMSFTSAKSLANDLQNSIRALEELLRYEIKTMDEVNKAFESEGSR